MLTLENVPRQDKRIAIGAAIAACLAIGSMVTVTPMSHWAGGLVFAAGLIAAGAVDARHQIVPDIINALLVASGLAFAALIGADEALNRSIGAAVGYLSLAGLAAAYRRLRGRDGLGLGDAKLLAGCGAWLGWTGLPPVLLAASMSGLIYAALMTWRGGSVSATTRIAFAPHLAIGAWVVWLARSANISPQTNVLIDFF